jgi:hypothetical protein
LLLALLHLVANFLSFLCRGKSLIVDGNLERLWLRTHFRALQVRYVEIYYFGATMPAKFGSRIGGVFGLQVVLLTAMPTSLPPVGEDPFDAYVTLRNSSLRSTSATWSLVSPHLSACLSDVHNVSLRNI